MKEWHHRNERCLSCGGNVPLTEEIADRDHRRYDCVDCGSTVLEGLVGRDTTLYLPEDTTVPPFVRSAFTIDSSINPGAAGVWWNGRHRVGALHGVPVYGEEGFYDFVREVISHSQ